MITNDGKELIAKFLLGQAPAYATHIALGSGARPGIDLPRVITARSTTNGVANLTSPGHGYRIGDIILVNISATTYNGTYRVSNTTRDTISYVINRSNESTVATTGSVRLSMLAKRSMDFEMVRVPISSRGYVNDGGATHVVFAAEIPTSERYLISEAALWSAGSNANAANTDSRQLFTFGVLEGWKYRHDSTSEDVPFRAHLAPNPPDIDKAAVGKVFSTTSDTPVLTNAARAARYEPGRYMSNVVMLRGDSSKIDSTDQSTRFGVLSVDQAYANEFISLDIASLDLARNNPNDELKLAFSVVSKVADNPVTPAKTRVVVEFLHSDSDVSTGYARFYGEVNADDIVDNRYVVLTKTLSDLVVSGDFSWSKVRVARVYASCYDATNVLDGEHYVSLDSMRFDNVSSPNPIYAMTGYAVYSDGSSTRKPIYKIANTSSYIEFRAKLGVV